MKQRLWFHLFCCLAWLAGGAVASVAQAQTSSCGFFDPKVRFADGSSACLKEFDFLNQPGFVTTEPAQTYASLAGSKPRYAITLTADPQMCPFAQYMAWDWGGREADEAMPKCEDRLKQAVQVHGKAVDAPACKCDVLIDNGRTKLSRADFVAMTQLYQRQIALGNRAIKVAEAAKVDPVKLAAQGSNADVDKRATQALVAQALAANQGQELARLRTEAESSRRKQLELEERLHTEALAAAQRQQEALALRDQAAKERERPVVPVQATVLKQSARALVIGNSAYTNFGSLRNSRNDAQAIADKLTSFGIGVDLVLDADRDTLVKALNEYSGKATGKDVNLLFYAGHGLQLEGVNYIIPTNMRADGISVGYVKLNGIALNAVMDYMPAKTRLVFLDACRDNPAVRSLVASRGSSSVGLAPVSAATGTLIAYATKEGSVASDGNGMNSPYTTALLQHLDAPLDISIILRRVRQTVLQITSNGQEPWEYGSLVGDQLVLSQMSR
jgi:hypothetical protein